MSDFRILERLVRNPVAERAALIDGLLRTPASIPPKYFYDALGCALFAAICELPEYYPTRTERAIFALERAAIARALPRGAQFVDLGAGDSRKAEAWLPVLVPARYIAVDFAGDEIARSLARLAPEFPAVELLGIVADFTRGLDLRHDLAPGPVTFFYPGSSIGNFAPPDALALLRDVHLHCIDRPGSGLLIGVDTRKAKARLDAAYDDALGVTAAFNRNVLHHVNRLLDADFRPEAFAHVAFFDEAAGRIEMHLEARSDQIVRLPDATRTFAAGERIHTENSYKYAPGDFARMLQDAGFGQVWCWQDDARDFAVFYAS